MIKVTDRVKEHGCRINWGDSSKEMESDLGVDMLVLTRASIQNLVEYCFGDHENMKNVV